MRTDDEPLVDTDSRMSHRDAHIRTKKAARAAGYRPWQFWINRWSAPRADVQPLVLRGEAFYQEEDCEVVFARTSLKKQGRRPRRRIEPVGLRSSRGRHGLIDLFRMADTEVIPERPCIPPKEINLLEAIRAVSRSAKRYRDAARSCYELEAYVFATSNRKLKEELYALKDIGICNAHSIGRLDYVGMHAGFAVYRGGEFCFHSTYAPVIVLEDAGASDNSEKHIFLEARPRHGNEPRLKDATHTLRKLALPNGYKRVNAPERASELPYETQLKPGTESDRPEEECDEWTDFLDEKFTEMHEEDSVV